MLFIIDACAGDRNFCAAPVHCILMHLTPGDIRKNTIRTSAAELMTGGPKVVNLLDVASHKLRQYLGAPGWDCRHAKYSPDGCWVAFMAARVGSPARPYVVRYQNNATPKESDWIAATDEDVEESDLDWAPGGRLLYFTTRANGRLTLGARRFDPSSGTFSGAPFPVYTFSNVRRVPPRSFPISVARDRIVCTLETLTSEVWLMTP